MKSTPGLVGLSILLAGSLLPIEAKASSLTWNPVGQPIGGGLVDDASGWAVDIDDAGDTIAVSAPLGADNKGQVRVLDWNNARREWVQRGETITGDDSGSSDISGEPGDLMGMSIDLTADGQTLLVSAPVANDRAGTIRVYDWNETSSEWEQRGEDLVGEAGDLFGWNVAISDDGDTLISGSFAQSLEGDWGSSFIDVFQWDELEGWQPKGSDLNSDTDGFTGWSVAISDDGDTIAFSNIDPASESLVSVYDWDSMSADWNEPRNVPLDAGVPLVAVTLSMSSDGDTLAAGVTPLFADVQIVVVFDWDADTEDWVIRGEPLGVAELYDLFFFLTRTISLNSAGTTLVVDFMLPDDEGGPSVVIPYDWSDGEWTSRDPIIANDVSAYSVAVAADGSRVVVGQSLDSDTGPSGAVVYQWGEKSRVTNPARQLTLDPAGGTCSGRSSEWTERFRHNFILPTANDCRRDGFAFLGWTRDPVLTAPEYLLTGSTSRATHLTAVWGRLPTAPGPVNVVANFLCTQKCTSAIIVSPVAADPAVTTIDGLEASCTAQGEVFGLHWCYVTGLVSGTNHTASVSWRNQYGVGPATTTAFTLL